MAVLRIITNRNDHTVYFKEPNRKFQFIKLLRCSLYNSWHTIKKNGKIKFQVNKPKGSEVGYVLYPGHYNIQNVVSYFSRYD